MKTSSPILLDTNILVYAVDQNSLFYKRSRNLIERGFNGEIDLCVSLQIMSEFYAVITDPRRVESPRSQEEALTEIKKYLYSENIGKIYHEKKTEKLLVYLLERYPVKKQEIFDLQLVATMISNQVRRICTVN